MIPGSAPFAPAAPGKAVQRLMEVCRYKGGQAAHSNQVHCSTGPGVHVSGGSSAFLFQDRTAPRQEAWHDSQQRKRRERSRLVAMFVIRSDAVASKKSASALSPHRKGVGKDTGQGISVFTPDSRNGFRHMTAYSMPGSLSCRQCTGCLLAGNL